MKGAITISRPSGWDKRFIRIEVQDELSRAVFLQIEMDLDKFAEAITGLGYTDCEFTLKSTDVVGLKREFKTEKVPVSSTWNITPEEIETALQPFEIDGWQANKNNFRNHHNRVKDENAFMVSFYRFVSS
jgi:hypothetical protein